MSDLFGCLAVQFWFRLLATAASRLFRYVDLYAPDGIVEGIVMTNSKDFVEHVMRWADHR